MLVLLITGASPVAILIDLNKTRNVVDSHYHDLPVGKEDEVDMLALAGVGVGDAEADEAAGGVELLEPGGEGEAEVGVGGIEVGEVRGVVGVGEEDAADDLVRQQPAQNLHPHLSRSLSASLQRSIDELDA